MLQLLDATTLLQLLDAASEAVRQTIVTGGWSGCVWPGHPEWDDHETFIQIRSLALHYCTVRYPAADVRQLEMAAQLLASQSCVLVGDSPLEEEPLYQQALLWLWALAGGISAPGSPGFILALPPENSDRPRLPGGDPVAFTAAALSMLEALMFTGDTAAQQVAVTFLRSHPGQLAQRALELVDAVVRQDLTRVVDEGVTCVDCGAQDLDMWYTGQAWGDTLCAPCYEARVAQGQARPQDA